MKKIILTKGKTAIVDEADYDWLNQWKWHYAGQYAVRRVYSHTGKRNAGRTICMHRLLMSTPEDMEVDHISGDKLDNRRKNLRNATHNENLRNMKRHTDNVSGYKGVSPHQGKWMAKITIGGNQIYLGMFIDKSEAAKVYNEAALKYHGKFARLNAAA